jgi:hypothetical protein
MESINLSWWDSDVLSGLSQDIDELASKVYRGEIHATIDHC